MRPLDQIIEEIPVLKLRRTHLRTYRGQCKECGLVHSTDPLQVGHATGSAKVQLGPNSICWVLKLRHRYGLSVRNACHLLQDAFHLKLSPGAISQLEQRMAQKLLPDYEQLIRQARTADYLHVDETSWYVGQPGHWLWDLTNEDLTVYQISSRRDRQTLEQLLGPDFDGVLISDCAAIYEHFCERQQKCYAHHLKAIKDALQACPQSSYLKAVQKLLRKAIGFEASRNHFEPPDYQRLCDHLEKKADQLLPTKQEDKGHFHFDQQSCSFELNPTELKVARRIAKRRQHLFTFLYEKQVQATNNLAERQLRPAVIQRKISCGNKTQKGADTWKVLRSIMVTDRQRNHDFSSSICQALKRHLCER